jgi:homocysteine S-methyltransferase
LDVECQKYSVGVLLKNPLVHRKSPDDVVILDGGLATELERRGFKTSGGLWSARVLLEHPEAIEQLHYDYYAAGAECVISSSYQVTYEGCANAGLSHAETTALLLKSVALANDARKRIEAAKHDGRKRYVAASVGPYGARLQDGSEYHGRYNVSVADIAAFHEERFGVLVESSADLLACETIPILDEARALATVLRNHPRAKAWFTFTTPDGEHTSHGETLFDAARFLDGEPGVVAIGVNCLRPTAVATALREISKGTGKPLVAYPNSGETWNSAEAKWDGAAEGKSLAELAPSWVELGARFVGGCCRTGPADIARLAGALDKPAGVVQYR